MIQPLQQFRDLVLKQWNAIDAQAEHDRAVLGGRRDWRPIVALAVCAFDLTLLEYFGRVDPDFLAGFFPPHYVRLGGYFYWSAFCFLVYVLIPVLALVAQGEDPRKYGLELAGFRRHLGLYSLLYAGIFPLVVTVSFTAPFQATYPFYKDAGRSWVDFLSWQILYSLQFVYLEFFFRGFLVFSMRRALGVNAIFAMMVPYCMIHFGKPFLETVGAMFAGVILGTLALRTRSIWLGCAIHIAVAWTMDILALSHRGQFPPAQWTHSP